MSELLAIETSTGVASLALLGDDGRLVADCTFEANRTMASRLAPMLQGLLRAVDRHPHAIGAVAVGLGPGSFTSLRVGLATAKGIVLGASSDTPLIGVGSLEVLAAAVPLTTRRPVCAVIAAPKRNVYAAVYARIDDDHSNCLLAPALLPLAQLVALLADMGQETVVVGNLGPAERCSLARPGILFAAPIHDVPRAAVLGDLARRRLARGGRHDVDSLAPLYTEPSEPEQRLGRTFANPSGPANATDLR